MRNIKTIFKTRKITKKINLVVVATVMAVGSVIQLSPHTYADKYDDQISSLQAQIDSFNAQASQYAQQETSLQAALSELNAQISAMQAQVNLSQQKYDKITAEIDATQQKITAIQAVLASTIGDMYVDSKTTALELVASSDNISDYVNSQQYSDIASEQIQASIKQIKNLKADLVLQQTTAKALLDDQTAQNNALAQKRQEQQQLLAETQGNEENYKNLANQSQAQVANIRAAQAAALRAANAGSGIAYGTSSYPWNGASMNYNNNCRNYDTGAIEADVWGYCLRQCVSYVAWKLANDGRGNSGYKFLGNAINWKYYGNPVDPANIRAGDVIEWDVGSEGHVMYVDSVSGTRVNISQYNVPYDSGLFSTKTYNVSDLYSGVYHVRRFN